MSPPRKRPPPNLRATVKASADTANIDTRHLDAIFALGSIAGFLTAHREIGRRIAFKGGAIMHYVDQSPRLSRDLDGSMVTGRELREEWVREALTTLEARKIVTNVGVVGSRGKDGIAFPYVECRPMSGIESVTVSIGFNWDERLIDPPIQQQIVLPNRSLTIPVMTPSERAAEKLRAYLTRRSASDPYDLYQYATNILRATDSSRLPDLTLVKLQTPGCPLKDGERCRDLFESRYHLLGRALGR